MPKGFSSIILVFAVAILIAFFLGYLFSRIFSFPSSSTPNLLTPELTTQKEEVLAEKIPGSKFHSPDATWWGYNQSKIVRFKDLIFTYYIDNDDDSNKTSSRFVVLKKVGENGWEEGAMFPTSRPGNLIIDSKGVLHAFVFEPFDVSVNDSWGRILHYYFPNSSTGDIKNYKKEIIVDNDGKSETANIRIGAAIGEDDTMAISFGLTKFNPEYTEQSVHIYWRSQELAHFKRKDEQKWNHTFKDGFQHDYFYPFTLVSKDAFYLLPIQDDFTGQGNPNIYQKILFLEINQGVWRDEMIVDLSNHPLAKSRPRLLEQEDLYQDKNGNIHILYKEFLDEKNTYSPTVHWHVSGKLGDFKKEQIKFDKPGINWVRLLEVDGKLYYLVTTFGEVFISPVDNTKLTKIDLPDDVQNNYPYVSTPKAGSTDSKYVDILLLGADKKIFEEGKNTSYYVRIPKSLIKNQ